MAPQKRRQITEQRPPLAVQLRQGRRDGPELHGRQDGAQRRQGLDVDLQPLFRARLAQEALAIVCRGTAEAGVLVRGERETASVVAGAATRLERHKDGRPTRESSRCAPWVPATV
jgi:hypothetical protein